MGGGGIIDLKDPVCARTNNIETGPNMLSGNSDEFATVLHDIQSWPFSNQPKVSAHIFINPVAEHSVPIGVSALENELFDVKMQGSFDA
jgi:hypothetical protein